MRRCLAIFLLVLLPFQFSWAAVAAYCAHESDAAQQHVGHHDSHPDHIWPSTPDAENSAPTDGPPTPAGLDCGHCHGNCASLLGNAKVPAAASQAAHPVMRACGTLGSCSLSPPERPQWARLA